MRVSGGNAHSMQAILARALARGGRKGAAKGTGGCRLQAVGAGALFCIERNRPCRQHDESLCSLVDWAPRPPLAGQNPPLPAI